MVYTLQAGVNREKIGKLSLFFVALISAVTLTLAMFSSVFAAHNGAVVAVDSDDPCAVTTFTAEIADPAGTHKVANMRLVVHDGTDTHVSDVIPTNGDTVEVEVGPFPDDTTVQWRVFGGGERSYDQPLWNGFGGATFAADINAYATSVGGFDWTVAGPDDPNLFTTWNELEVEGCSPVTMDDCKQDGYAAFGFRNQGLCIQYANTGKDSR